MRSPILFAFKIADSHFRNFSAPKISLTWRDALVFRVAAGKNQAHRGLPVPSIKALQLVGNLFLFFSRKALNNRRWRHILSLVPTRSG